MLHLKRKRKSIRVLCKPQETLTEVRAACQPCVPPLSPKERPFKIHLYLFIAAWRWEATLVTGILSWDSVAFRKSFVLKTTTVHAVHLDVEILSTATSFYMKSPQENTTEACDTSGNEECGGVFLDTGHVDRLPLPSELRFASPMQISTDLCCWTIGMCSSHGESKDNAVTWRWHFPKGFHAAHHEFLYFQRLKALRIFISTQKSTCQMGRGCSHYTDREVS